MNLLLAVRLIAYVARHTETLQMKLHSGVAVVLLAALSACATPARQPLSVHLLAAAGPSPTDCGTMGPFADESSVGQAVDCLRNAARAGRSAVATFEGLSVDSAVASGVITRADGAFASFSYDSAPCGGPGCPDEFVLGPCIWPIVRAGAPARLGCGPPSPKVAADLRSRIEAVSGQNPVDCGQHASTAFAGPDSRDPRLTAALLRPSLACATKSSAARLAFWASTQAAGIDSWIAHGLVGKRDGTILGFSYDSSPCGGPNCESRFTTTNCPNPRIAQGGAGASFVCG